MSTSSLPTRRHTIIKNTTALTMDSALGEIVGADIEILDGEIVGIGPGLEASGAAVIDGTNTITLPGFVDSHWHVWGTLLRGVVGDGPEHGWFATKGRLGGHFTSEDFATGVRLGMAEGISAGITTVHDWSHNIMCYEDAEANLAVHRELGTRVHFSYSAPSAHPSMPMEKMREILAKGGLLPDAVMDFDNPRRIAEDWVPSSESLLTVGVAVRGPARSTPEVYREEWRLAREQGLTISMHCAGTEAEVERIHQIEVLEADGLLGDDMLLAHCLYISSTEREYLADFGIPVSMSPLSELRLGMGSPPINEHVAAGVQVSLSLDTTAISATADVFQAMRVAVGLQSISAKDATALTPRRVLEMTTIDGARALGLEEVIGSLTIGKRADLIMVRTDELNMAPVWDPVVAIVHSAQPSNVDTVMLDGRILKWKGELTTVNTPKVIAEAEDSLKQLCERAGFKPR
jgi:5-methylthioadenosine/S-adenosylhomocysteine deaminase